MILLPNRAPLAKPAGWATLNMAHPLARHVVFAHFGLRQRVPPLGTTSIEAYDSSLNQLHGTSGGGINIKRMGKFGAEFAVNTTTGAFTIPDGPKIAPAALTIIARVKSTATGNRQWVAIKGSVPIPYWLAIADSVGGGAGAGVGWYNGGYFVSGITRDISGDNQYHVVAGTILPTGAASSVCSYYIDGQLDKSAAVASVMPSNSSTLNVGGPYPGDNSCFIGVIESIVLLNVALRADQVARLSADLYSLITPTRQMTFAPGYGAAGSARPAVFVCT